MPVSDLKQLSHGFAAAANAGDLDALCGFYADDAIFVGPDGHTAAGKAAIREVLAGFLASKPSMQFTHEYVYESGDTALARGKWTLTSTGPDGAPSTMSGSSIEVVRRQPDGSWRYVIDHPWGGDAR
jgi:uncharacterized protein (TIGR02246 family)